MRESAIFGNGQKITSNSMLNRENTEKAKKFDVREAQEQLQFSETNAYNAGQNDGFRAGYSDFEKRLAASQNYAPIVEGSPEDLIMQQNINDGINYQEEEGPSLRDAISSKFSDMFSSNSAAEPDPYEDLAASEKESLRQDAATSAFVGDTSEEAMNIKYAQELKQRGL